MITEIYVVQPGDTLTTITERYQVSPADLSLLNGSSIMEPLVVGQAILIPAVQKAIQSFGYFHLEALDDLELVLAQLGEYFSLGGVFQSPVTTGGAIVIPADEAMTRAVELLKASQVGPLMVITNLSEKGFDTELAKAVIGDPAVKAILVRNIAVLLQHYGFAGVNVDFENLAPDDRDQFTDFISSIQQTLHPDGYLVTLTVPPKNTDVPADNPSYKAFDYQALGKVADFIFIMTYDWGNLGSPPRAVAPLDEVRKVLEYARQTIPLPKIIQGIPLYGYNWQLPYGPESKTTTVNLVEPVELARRYQAAIHYDPVAQSPFFNYVEESGQEHMVWFEDARSVKAKYKTAWNFGLGGVGFWSSTNIPYGFPQNWPIFSQLFHPIKLSRLDR